LAQDLHLNATPKKQTILAFSQYSLSILAMCLLAAACSPKAVRAPSETAPVRKDNYYLDLAPEWRLRIVAPLPGAQRQQYTTLSEKKDGTSISVELAAPELAGYQVSIYSVEDSGDGKVRLRFASAETTRDGRTIAEKSAPALPFVLPKKTGHIRLVYLIRVSYSDHNMAVVLSKKWDALNAFTKELQRNPEVCNNRGEVSCIWVPAQIAVRPEHVAAPDR
jgi:hypothetical protein